MFSAKFIHSSARLHIKNYYEILGIARGANQKAIKAAYYEKAKLFHPDSNKKVTTDKFRDISEAYEVLSDEEKRRAYDSTTRQAPHGLYGQRTARSDPFTAHQRGPREPVSMNHIHYVYRTLNRQEPEEKPQFRMFEDHHYPGTKFNRFEYVRQWDKESGHWIYMKRADVRDYHRQMKEKSKILQLCIAVVMFGSLAFILIYKSYIWMPYVRQIKGPQDKDKTKTKTKTKTTGGNDDNDDDDGKEPLFFWETGRGRG